MGSSMSRQRRRAARRHGQTLLDLPMEVQVKILCYLDTGDLVACRSVCRTLLTICNDEMAVQYTSTLGGAGMVDDVPPQPPQDVSLRARYVAILKYLIAWKNVDNIPHRIHTPTQGEIFLEHTNGVSVYAIPAHPALKLHRPGSQLTLLPELTFSCTAWNFVLETRMLSRARYTVDLSQDLLIISLRVEGQEENINEHHFFSIFGDQYPHPQAASSVFRAPCSHGRIAQYAPGSDQEDYVDVLSDLVVWGHYSRTSEKFSATACMEVQVTNWKTGAVVWRYKTNRVTCYYLIDRHHIVLILNNSIHVFSFDPDRHASQGPPAYTRPGAHLLHLQLPRLEFRAQLGDTTALLRIPRPHPADRPLFRQDPGAALLALIMTVNTLEPWWSSRDTISHLTILVPLSTIRTHIGHTGARILRTPALPWQDWGPGGARVVRTHEVLPWHIALHGSRCVLTNDTILEHVLVIDAHRWVRQAGPGLVRCKLLITEKDVDASDVVTFVTERSFVDRRKPIEKKTEQIEGRFPCRLMYEPIWGVPALRWKTTFATDEEVVLVCTQIE
ncbi:hypothetical protein L226DRAFT_614674 [Lentinus tigrinus ALCF2SS1-7]|uniref:F-box domain-containing protein n=1 Tax=Lentinus tigrinus ALCF2SS1-6 TaxID=1328759 RepID=A0A5C2S4G7_9APHY|nr:hypothetical protein L227DRAFT_654630 [Lentinus tigrinus ALCF2SS1-6]RPD72817.1 hypothetical protein L226DRAFT_614674 [Lentinus tigrinus ALCF2SS1-7]